MMMSKKKNMRYVEKAKRGSGDPKYVPSEKPPKKDAENRVVPKPVMYKKPELVAESDDDYGRVLGCPMTKGDMRICQRLNIRCMIARLK